MDRQNLDELRSEEALSDYREAIRSEITSINTEFAGLPLPDDRRSEFAELNREEQAVSERLTEIRARQAVVARFADNPRNHDTGALPPAPTASMRERDIYDLSQIRGNMSDPGGMAGEMRDRALRAVEFARFPQAPDRQRAQAHVQRLIDGDDTGIVARRILTTGSPVYQRAFFNAIAGRHVTSEEARALSLTGASGGFAVPFDLDPTIIPTSNGTVNPLRAIARVVQITGDEWRGVSSGAITTAYAAEATETTDNAPTLAQPTISTEKAQAFIPFSIEVGMDWGGLRAEMGTLLQDSKDELEAAKFVAGTGTNEPFGLLTGITNTVNAAAGQTMTLANLYSLRNALPPRYRPRAVYLGNLAIENRIRQFDTAGGAAIWETLSNDSPPRLLGKPWYEVSDMVDVATSAKFMVYGDPSRFVIVDRIGLEVELIQHLVGTNHRPTGQRGLYAFWRNSSKVVDANAFRALLGVA